MPSKILITCFLLLFYLLLLLSWVFVSGLCGVFCFFVLFLMLDWHGLTLVIKKRTIICSMSFLFLSVISASVSYFGAEKKKKNLWMGSSDFKTSPLEKLPQVPSILFRIIQKSCKKCGFHGSHLFPPGIRCFFFSVRRQRLHLLAPKLFHFYNLEFLPLLAVSVLSIFW